MHEKGYYYPELHRVAAAPAPPLPSPNPSSRGPQAVAIYAFGSHGLRHLRIATTELFIASAAPEKMASVLTRDDLQAEAQKGQRSAFEHDLRRVRMGLRHWQTMRQAHGMDFYGNVAQKTSAIASI